MKVSDFKKILAEGHLYKCLFHFTDESNIPSILKHGLLSKSELTRLNIEVKHTGGNDWSSDADSSKNLNSYVNLCFTRNHPLCHIARHEGRVPNPKYLEISPAVLDIQGVKVTLGVANKVGVDLLDIEEGLNQLDVEVLYTHTNWKDFTVHSRLLAAEKCELLVPKSVPSQLMKF